jgi:hypothetical protein
MFGRLMGNFNKHPDVAQATKIGEPTLVDPTPMSATDVVQQATRAMIGPPEPGKASVEAIGSGNAPPPDQTAPRSDAPPQAPPPATGAQATGPDPATGSTPGKQSVEVVNGVSGSSAIPAASSAGELTPNASTDSNELKPNVDQPQQPPAQVNELQNAGGAAPAATKPAVGPDGKPVAATATDTNGSDEVEVSSKKKKKKGIHKVVPF